MATNVDVVHEPGPDDTMMPLLQHATSAGSMHKTRIHQSNTVDDYMSGQSLLNSRCREHATDVYSNRSSPLAVVDRVDHMELHSLPERSEIQPYSNG